MLQNVKLSSTLTNSSHPPSRLERPPLVLPDLLAPAVPPADVSVFLPLPLLFAERLEEDICKEVMSKIIFFMI
jgi:hypothetical protein